MDTLALALHTQAGKIGNFEFDLTDFDEFVSIYRENGFDIPTEIESVITEMKELFQPE